MKTANSLITLILLLTAVFSVVTTNAVVTYASTENEAVLAQGDYSILEGDDPNTPEEEHDEDNNTFEVECWNGELVDDVNDCPVDEGNIVCDDGSFAVRISDCPTGSSPPPSQDDLPLCDGSVQDCVTEEGFFCEAGVYEDECECEEDMSDCPNHPKYDEIVRQGRSSQ